MYFDLRLPPDAIDTGKLSALQLESVIYASQQHMNILPDGTRAGFLVGTSQKPVVSGSIEKRLWPSRVGANN